MQSCTFLHAHMTSCYGKHGRRRVLTFLELAHMPDATPRLPPGSASTLGCFDSSLGSCLPMSFETLIKSFQEKSQFHVLDGNQMAQYCQNMMSTQPHITNTNIFSCRTQLIAISRPSSVISLFSKIWTSQPKKALCKVFETENAMNRKIAP